MIFGSQDCFAPTSQPDFGKHAPNSCCFGLQARSRGDIKAPFIAVLRADKRTQQPMVAVTMMGGGSGAGGGSKRGFTGKPDAIKTAADTAGERGART